MNENIKYYEDNYRELTEMYNSLTFNQVHESIVQYLPNSGVILDVGCGSGRDSNALANMGFEVIATDPSINMLNTAKETFKNQNITWINDKLPSLDNIKSLNKKFDFILLSAVWMHIELHDRKEAFNSLRSLLNENGKMVITLRHGKFNDSRKEIPVSISEIENFSSDIQTKILSSKEDSFKREVDWEIILIQNTPKLKKRNKLKPK